jgi:hypothetical protein
MAFEPINPIEQPLYLYFYEMFKGRTRHLSKSLCLMLLFSEKNKKKKEVDRLSELEA